MLNSHFDNIYVLNVDSRSDRMEGMKKRLSYFDITYERFNAISGNVTSFFYKNIPATPSFSFKGWPSSNTLACNLSHLSIYEQALKRGESNILILEDDIRIHRNIHHLIDERMSYISSHFLTWDLLYLCYIPVTDDGQFWDFSILDSNFIYDPGTGLYSKIFRASNLWSLMGYGISKNLMSHLLSIYSQEFPMEIDRHFVDVIHRDPRFVCLGVSPTLISGENLGSDNQPGHQNTDFMVRTVDTRFSTYWDYV